MYPDRTGLPPNKALKLTPKNYPLPICGTVLAENVSAPALTVSAVWCS